MVKMDENDFLEITGKEAVKERKKWWDVLKEVESLRNLLTVELCGERE